MGKSPEKNIVLIGAGIMSATLGAILNILEPDWRIKIFEKLDQAGLESSNEWNNAGTGHAALCELNYTVEQTDGSIDCSRAVDIFEQFLISKQFWAYLVESGELHNPSNFIRKLPHNSFVCGEKHVKFLKKRYDLLSSLPMFEAMEYSEDPLEISEWMPLLIRGRVKEEPIAATRVKAGTDVNFGNLARNMIKSLESKSSVQVQYQCKVTDLERKENDKWSIKIHNTKKGINEYHSADFVFIGAGGGAIPLLQKTKIPESRHIGGFPISGEFLVCTNPNIINKHNAKVYGKEPDGTPPMTVPHLDRRYINGEKLLLFGPFAAFGPKFLKYGSNSDFIKSLKMNNILTLLTAGIKNIPLIKYSVKQVLSNKKNKMEALRNFYPEAKDEDWEVIVAGKRVQLIKDIENVGKGVIQFGTEIINSEDNSLVALLGESPGASTSVSIILDILKQNFPNHIETWKPKLKEMIQSYDQSLLNNPSLLEKIQESNSRSLKL